MSKVLILIDCQNDFLNPRGSLVTPEAITASHNIAKRIGNVDYKKLIFTRDTHFKETYNHTQEGIKLPVEHCIRDTWGWELDKTVMRAVLNSNYSIYDKQTFGFLHWQYIIDPDVDTIELAGVCTDICVVSNALILKATFPEKRIVINQECCAGVTPEAHAAALKTMQSCQIEVI